jgi:hypothetical protein
MVSDSLIHIERYLLRSGSFCRALHPHRQVHSRNLGRDVYPLAIRESIKFIIIGSVPDQDSSDDYPEIGVSAYGDSVREGCLIFMVAPNGDPSHNNSNRYPTIGRSEAFDARTLDDRMIRNLDLDFNAIRFQTIMESIQQIAHEGTPLIALAQQGAEVANVIMA